MTDHFFDGHPEGVPPAHHDPAPRPAALADDDLFWATFRLGNVHRVLLRSMEQDLENEDLPTPYAMFRSVGNDALRAEIQSWVDEINKKFARVEQVKKFTILPRNLTVEDGELTPTLKVKRRIVDQNWGDAIDAMYE